MNDEIREQVAGVISETLGWDWPATPEERIPSGLDECGKLADALMPRIREAQAEAWTRLHDQVCDLGAVCSAHQPPPSHRTDPTP